ncbi:bifunctional diaminohydroxyphosphoribosylaminopyrimidine deaminase/5-amino-6-(5-phosphoribosylamino)uracil reductase RibD [Kocuria palustris]|uniref:bifunctional diaminohydroxyphosphoribosylaminopyrimidine deaminase/5-amino-6-(5-phosphoribosylamino)uracil reductase RibD n=1 Tax=Kocuria palustris TaxID=71999 RepID=UPI0021B2B011|nr:bifunctional diaminohydroxyphosphoribosylaminopyrimidine deaminase/5-amino-6-(5-phosphoribosylamino)uracil reductase RibD [Kocuria palustris]
MTESSAPSSAGFSAAETAAMHRALELALEGPRSANPLVGAVLLGSRGEILHTGRHLGAGTPHAEADLLRQARAAGTQLGDTTIVVTLEPCDHTGRTGPCSRAILEAGIPRAVFAVEDTQAGAGGAQRLRAAGVEVRSGLLAEQSRLLNERWSRAGRESRPFVTAKIAQSLDGRIAAADGTSRWITGPEARSHGHGLRARADAIAVGTGTALADDPRLTARTADGPLPADRQPLRAVIGRRQIPEQAAMRGDDGRFLRIAAHDPREALARLWEGGARHVLIEGGAGLTSAFLAADLVDELLVYQAPLVLGGGRPSIEIPAVRTLSDAPAFEPDPADGGPVRRLGADLLWHLRPRPGPSG